MIIKATKLLKVLKVDMQQYNVKFYEQALRNNNCYHKTHKGWFTGLGEFLSHSESEAVEILGLTDKVKQTKVVDAYIINEKHIKEYIGYKEVVKEIHGVWFWFEQDDKRFLSVDELSMTINLNSRYLVNNTLLENQK